jgi:site-specific DNA-methyltransferase (adenine-specific)
MKTSWAIHTADCLDFLRTLPDGSVDAVVTDPPFGMNLAKRSGTGRSKACRALDDYRVIGDDKPFDPSAWLGFPVVAMFGANHYAHLLPPARKWLVWDKRDGGTSDDQADCELAWTNARGPGRLLSHKWRGMIKASERDQKRVHPTQKPIELMKWVMDQLEIPDGATVFDPYCGSGTTGVACIQTGRNFIGCEIDPGYANIARRRCREAEESVALLTGGAA